MKRRRHTPEQIVRKLREADRLIAEGMEVPEIAKALEVSEQTYHRWRAQFGGMQANDVKRLKELERENAQLKRLVADKESGEPRVAGDFAGKLVSPSRRRAAVLMLQDRLGLSERRACRYVGQHHSTQRREPCVARDDGALRGRLREISMERPRWGYRRAHATLRGEGWEVNRKRVQRLWREEGLRVPVRRKKRRRPGNSTVPAARLAAERPDHVWAIDSQSDQTADGRILKLLHVVDELTREALAVERRRRIDADPARPTAPRSTCLHQPGASG